MSDRKTILLRATYDLLKRNAGYYYVKSPAETMVFYDDANCGGTCLMEDIANELGIDDDTPPIPLRQEDGE